MGAKKPRPKEIPQDDRFQAVVLTDSYETRLMPVTASMPRCLVPLCNVPLIEYTMEFLAKAGVNEVYVMCLLHADQIQAYLENLKWANIPGFSVVTVLSTESRSVGDAMRDVDNRGLITGDFLLVSGDVVTNIDFLNVVAAHTATRARDRDHIVTMVVAPASAHHRARLRANPAVFVLENELLRCHYYQGIDEKRGGEVAIDPELLEGSQFDVRNDLIDCHIDICLPHVPQIFQENFDYQLLRGDFVRGVLTSDLVKKSIYAYIAEEGEYGARVELWATYLAISQDVMARWCYPLVPDANWAAGSSFSYEFNHIYKEEKVVLAQLSRVSASTCIGEASVVGDALVVERLVLGRRCTVGTGARIVNSYIWDGAEIGDHVTVDGAVVAAGAVLRAGLHVGAGAVVGPGVVIGENQTVAPGTRLTVEKIARKKDDFADSDDDSSSDAGSDAGSDSDIDNSLVGPDGCGFAYFLDLASDSTSLYSSVHSSVLLHLALLNLLDDSIALITKKKYRKRRLSRRFSSTSVVSTDYERDAFTEDEEDEDFHKEAVATVLRAVENGHDLDTALLELNTLRMSMNVTYHEVRDATVAALIHRIVHFVSTDTLAAKDAAFKLFGEWGPMFKRQVFNGDEQADLAQILQTRCAALDPAYGPIVLFFAIRRLYELDVLEEEAIFQWWESAESKENEPVRAMAGQFVAWLAEDDEDDEEEDE